MASLLSGINLVGTGTSVQMSTAINCTVPLSQGQYAVWSLGQVGYISMAVTSSLFTAATGFPVQPQSAGSVPILLNVPNNGQIGVISTSSGTLVYQQVG